mmetsp:Transcript_30177/g.54278  ORF Transcript_30177/g.54278 Transcript_30177/m.54278 type:complete len:83 (+) Transcript_30177:466-714(+)
MRICFPFMNFNPNVPSHSIPIPSPTPQQAKTHVATMILTLNLTRPPMQVLDLGTVCPRLTVIQSNCFMLMHGHSPCGMDLWM